MTIEKTTTLLGIYTKTEVVEPTDSLIPLALFAYGISRGFPESAIVVTSPDTVDLNTYNRYQWNGTPSTTSHLATEDINAAHLQRRRCLAREVYKWTPHAPKHGTVYHVLGIPVKGNMR